MQRIYNEVRTPYKYGVVLRGEPGELVDCPNVFRANGRWYMVFVSNRERVGYQTELACSDDLLHWRRLGPILPFAKTGWDAWQADGGIALYDTRFDGTHELGTYEGRYWLSFLGGSRHGYEPDPLSIGLAWSTTPTEAKPWTRLPENPVLSTFQPDCRHFESVTLYKSAVIRDTTEATGWPFREAMGVPGWPFVMFYNGKTKKGNHEAIGMAVSRDLVHWTRMGDGPVVDNAPGKRAISGDPQIARIGNLWVMFYFGFLWKKGTSAFNTFACSYDLTHWTRWEGEPLIKPSVPYDKTFAHKPWVMKVDGIVYHFYCAVGKTGRVIALATSKDLGHP
ncbi:glycosyl hydrolases family 43 [mine drainage metagenome]|uniref:Glycosyl hydrolases family 43 n=1 Tax=mine drainage metagenome TaxID=410659 RepID=A0A1J5T7I7_9ZZZZ